VIVLKQIPYRIEPEPDWEKIVAPEEAKNELNVKIAVGKTILVW
jgi:hypothetical protein